MRQNHPTVVSFHASPPPRRTTKLSIARLKEIALECGADDAGAVNLSRPELASEIHYVHAAMPHAKAVLCIVKRMAVAPIQTPSRSLANNEFHSATDEVGEVGRAIAARLEELGIRALNTSAGFPMEMHQFPGRTWIIAHKIVAEAAGLGKMGIHRNVIHPNFGNFILLNSILLDCDLEDESSPIDYNPCLECKLCVAVCPVGAISSDGHFDSIACLNHNYREFMGGFIDWVDTLADSKGKADYHKQVTDQETASWWQSLSTGPNYKSAYCMAACPAGEDIIGRFLVDKGQFVKEVVKPLQQKVEPIYVVKGSDAEASVTKRFPNKVVRRISSGVRPSSIAQLLEALPLAFQRGQSKSISAIFDFHFTGDEDVEACISIKDQTISVDRERSGSADLSVQVDSKSWLDFLAGRTGLAKLVLLRRLKFQGDLRLLAKFGRCFPS